MLEPARRRRADDYRACGAPHAPRAARSTRTLDPRFKICYCMEWLANLWLRHFQPQLDALWDSLSFWRVYGLLIASAAVVLVLLRRPLLTWIRRTDFATHDRTLFAKFLTDLPSTGSISFIRDFDFRHSFRSDVLNDLDRFYHGWNNAEHEFLDQQLEALRAELYEAVERFLNNVGRLTAPTLAGLQSVIPKGIDPDINLPAHVRSDITLLNDCADVVHTTHQELGNLCTGDRECSG